MTRWVGSRVARPVRDLTRARAFYSDLLGLTDRGGFDDHDGYDGAFFELPGGGELELTVGPTGPAPTTDEDLLVLYVSSRRERDDIATRLATAGVPEARAANPYWTRHGRTFLDPDGFRIVVAVTRSVTTPQPPG